MDSLEKKSNLILAYEKNFATDLSSKVLDVPKLHIWMILIPVIFVHYIYEWQKYKHGRKDFAKNYLITKQKALDQAVTNIKTGLEPDFSSLSDVTDLPPRAQKELAGLFAILIEHYKMLLCAAGGDFESLVRNAYENLENYLLFLERLQHAEKLLNASIQSHIETTTKGAENIIGVIEKNSLELNKHHAVKIFK